MPQYLGELCSIFLHYLHWILCCIVLAHTVLFIAAVLGTTAVSYPLEPSTAVMKSQWDTAAIQKVWHVLGGALANNAEAAALAQVPLPIQTVD